MWAWLKSPLAGIAIVAGLAGLAAVAVYQWGRATGGAGTAAGYEDRIRQSRDLIDDEATRARERARDAARRLCRRQGDPAACVDRD